MGAAWFVNSANMKERKGEGEMVNQIRFGSNAFHVESSWCLNRSMEGTVMIEVGASFKTQRRAPKWMRFC